MANLLDGFMKAGLADGLGGQDDRLKHIKQAASTMAGELSKRPPNLIRAVLAGLDPDTPADEPLMQEAENAISGQWELMRSVYKDPPVLLMRFVLLEACQQAAKGRNAAILWLTAADALPLVRMGQEGPAVVSWCWELAEGTEELSFPAAGGAAGVKARGGSLGGLPELKVAVPAKANRDALTLLVAASVGPQLRNNRPPLSNPNPHWPQSNEHWSGEFAPRMTALLADELDKLSNALASQQTVNNQQVQAAHTALVQQLTQLLTEQQMWVESAIQASKARETVEQVRLNALWWSEALYSPSLLKSYRSLDPEAAALSMAFDLLDIVDAPAPASVGHLLAETVNRLPNAAWTDRRPVSALLDLLSAQSSTLPAVDLIQPPAQGRLSLRDLLVLATGDRQWDRATALRRAGVSDETTMSLPELAHAFFRQEQAVRLAGKPK